MPIRSLRFTIGAVAATLGLSLSAAGPSSPPSFWAQAAAQAPTVVEAVCLEGGRPMAVCSCAERALYEELGPTPYADYEAVAAEYLNDPSGGWSKAATFVAQLKGISAEQMLNETKLYGQLHRTAMRNCA